MREVFADTGYWVAMVRPGDELHDRARRISAGLAEFHIVTTEMVLVEFFNAMSKGGPYTRRLACDTLDNLYDNANIEIVPQTSAQFAEAVSRYASRPDQRWSLTDCASFLLMERRNITEALAYDLDFRQAGFIALLRED